MPLPGSGLITLDQIQTEFGGVNPIGLNEYYKGGIYVPSGNPASIPSSGQIGLSNFYGAAAYSGGDGTGVLLTNTDKSITSNYNAGTNISGIGFNDVGKMLAYALEFASVWFEITPVNEWLNPESGSVAAGYEMRATTDPGSVYSYTDVDGYGTMTEWKRLGSSGSGGKGSRYFWIQNGSPGTTLTRSFTVQIRGFGGSTVFATANITLTSNYYP